VARLRPKPGAAARVTRLGERASTTLLALVLLSLTLFAQELAPPPAPAGSSAEYVLGTGDQVVVRVADLEEFGDKPTAIDGRGAIKLPLIGRIQAAGLTAAQLEKETAGKLAVYVKQPEVTVSIAEYRSQPVSLLGAVASPGVQQLQGRKSLFEVLSMAGGLRPDAGHSIRVTRRAEWGPIPLPTAAPDPTGQFSVAQVSVTSVIEARNPQENILICPNDVISVPKADTIYVIGAVKRAGGFVLNEREQVTVLQALSMAEGLDHMAASGAAKILRLAPAGSQRTEIAVNLKKILAGKSGDVPMRADDILFVPSSIAKSASIRVAEAALQITTGLVIWRR